MSKYDDERKKILERMQAGNVSFSSTSTSKYADERAPAGKSKYAAEREALYNPPAQQPVDFVGGVSRTVEGIKNFTSPGVQDKKPSTATQADNYVKQQSKKRLENDFFPEPVRNVLDSAAGVIDRLQVNNPVGRFINRFSQKAGQAVGVDTQAAAAPPMLSTGSKIADAAADFGGMIGGTLTNPSNIGQGLASAPLRIGQGIANRFSPAAPTLARKAIEGAAAGAIQGGVISGVRGETSVPEMATNIGLGAITGGVADPLLYGAGRGIGKLLNKNLPSIEPLPKSNAAAPAGRFGEMATPVEQSPGAAWRQPELLNAGLAPDRPMIKLPPEKDSPDAFNNGSGDASTFDQKINRTVTKKKTPFSQRWEKIRTQFVDDMAPLQGVEKRIKGSVSIAEESLYKSSRLFKGTPEKANQIVRDRLSPVVTSIEKSGKMADDLGRYALAVHAKDVNAAGYKSGFTNSEIDDVIRKYGTPEMETARQQLVQINNDMLKELVDSGVVSRELADVLNERWKNYIPLFRSFDDDMVGFSGGLSGALANVASPIKALKGSERAVIDPLENMVKNIFQSVNAAERNKVATQLGKLAQSDNEGKFIRQLSPDEQVGRKNVVNVKVNGENVKYEVEPEVYKAMLNMDQESSNMLMNILSKPASLLRAGATLTPEFSLRNPMRDVLQAFVTSKSGFNPVTDFTVGLIQSIKKGNLYKDWVDNLGAYGNIISQDRDVHRQALEKVLKQPASKKFVNIINGKGLINILRAISDTTESATKVGEYRAALRQGQTKAEAAYRSRDLMDFGRAGSSVRQANKVVAFLNANIQGKSKLIRAIKENPVGTITRAFTAVTLPTIGIYVLNHAYANETQKETIKEAPDWQKDSFWLMAVPGTDMVARIPKPFDLAAIFSNLPEKAMQFTLENDPQAFDGFVQRTLKSGALPAQISGLLPLVEGMANYSFFREGDIIPMREQNLEFRDQYDPIRTTETAKILAAGAQGLTGGKGAFKNFASPRIMDNTIKGLTAGLGTYATSAIDSILQGVGAVNRPKSPEKRIEQRPLARAFLVDPLQGGKSMDTFYQNREKLQKEKSSASVNERAFTKEPLLSYLNRVSDAMSDINKEIRYIERSDLQAKDKRQQIEPLIQKRNELAKSAVKDGQLR